MPLLPRGHQPQLTARAPSFEAVQATRKLASRARQRIHGTDQDAPQTERNWQRELAAASQRGDFTALLELLDPGVVYRADQAGVRMGAPGEVRSQADVAAIFSGRAKGAELASVNGAAAIVWAAGGQPRAVFDFTIEHGKITAIDMTADPGRLRQLDATILSPDSPGDGGPPVTFHCSPLS